MSSSKASTRRFIAIFALVGLIGCAPGLAEAKMGDLLRGGAGSRGSRTFSAPPPTNTARVQPRRYSARSLRRRAWGSRTQPGMQRPGFGRGLMGASREGFWAPGCSSFDWTRLFGGIGGFFSIIGFLFQIALLAVLARFAFMWWQNRNLAPAAPALARVRPCPLHRGPALARRRAAKAESPAFTIVPGGFSAFERLLGETQDAYGRETPPR